MKYSIILTSFISISLCACASSSVTQLSRNTAVVSTSAAPVCRTTGAASVANQMAVATIKAGYSRFVVGGFGTQNNTRIISTGPSYATTTGTFNRFGNTVYGSANTTFGGSNTIVAGSNEAEMQILMLKPGDPGYADGIDARTVLGPDWQKKVEDGINNCF